VFSLYAQKSLIAYGHIIKNRNIDSYSLGKNYIDRTIYDFFTYFRKNHNYFKGKFY